LSLELLMEAAGLYRRRRCAASDWRLAANGADIQPEHGITTNSPNGPILTFAFHCSGHSCECWNQRTTSGF